MIKTIAITDFRRQLGNLVREVRTKKTHLIIEKDGYPVVGVVDIDQFEDFLDATNPRIKAQIEQSNEDIKAGRVKPIEDLLKRL
jgi:prevent-host-death family protein